MLTCAGLPDYVQVERTTKANFLPVYTDIKKGRTQVVTMVRKASGDLEVRTGKWFKFQLSFGVLVKLVIF